MTRQWSACGTRLRKRSIKWRFRGSAIANASRSPPVAAQRTLACSSPAICRSRVGFTVYLAQDEALEPFDEFLVFQ